MLQEASEHLGRPYQDIKALKAILMETGFTGVTMQHFKWPTNPWPKEARHKELGVWHNENLAQGWEAICMAPLTRALQWTKNEVLVLMAENRKEFCDRSIHAYFSILVEWENHSRRNLAAYGSQVIDLLDISSHNPEFQLRPIPASDPVLSGTHWKMWHKEVGGSLFPDKKVINACGGLIKEVKHPGFYGVDTHFKDDETMNYLVRVPTSKVKANGVMLAWKINGEVPPLSTEVYFALLSLVTSELEGMG
ncbi:methyltransferase domain-containing protein [Colletotrichum orchidophilum]|uniref:Methyltransferase domain-containing protein n=1 Tax=Colletotrichum orchidophilum TaxID=1209926 RepID=A0A1G4B0H7_9PEZI|nr:methyltransferase domain-containing protein [Colletotrichum orchidophilum]OHE94894.1 methyltransferase domain-containing protein [Colletotrichum orchidophilum]